VQPVQPSEPPVNPPLQLVPFAGADVNSLGASTVPGAGAEAGESLPTPPDAQRRPFDLLEQGDAEIVQGRLKALGYFDGIVDGVWGPSSRSALKAFRRTQGLGGDDLWDTATQSALMSMQAAAAGSASLLPEIRGDTRFPPPTGALRNPLNRKDAVWIQRQLHDLGFYSGDGEGLWGPASRSALQQFKQENGLPANDTWDAGTEKRLSAAAPPHSLSHHGRQP
jgi:peptidoglycan hydrolase-like protein with peptidoglycan-binding domain